MLHRYTTIIKERVVNRNGKFISKKKNFDPPKASSTDRPLPCLTDLNFRLVETPVTTLDQHWESYEASMPMCVYNPVSNDYFCYYEGRRQPNESFDIGLSLSPDMTKWKTVSCNPVLTKQDVPFGNGYVADPSVIRTVEGSWHMYFDARSDVSEKGVTTIGRAQSTNGFEWKVTPPNPILEPQGLFSWESYSVHAPEVLRTDNGWFMLYSGAAKQYNYQTGLCQSKDGINWSRYPDGPLISFESAGELTASQARAGPVNQFGDKYITFVVGKDISSERVHNLVFISKDLVNWEFKGSLDIEYPPRFSKTRFSATGNLIREGNDIYIFGEGIKLSSQEKHTIGVIKTNIDQYS